MFYSWTVLFAGLAYVGVLFAVASFGDRLARGRPPGTPRPLIYALSLGVYCTSWTYFGSVGVASRSGFDFLPIYIGPILVFAVGWKLLADDRRHLQAPEHHLDRRFHRGALRQERDAGGAGGAHRRQSASSPISRSSSKPCPSRSRP